MELFGVAVKAGFQWMYVWESYEVQYLANDASKLQTFDEKSVQMLIVWHRRESDIPVDICE